MPKKDTSSEIAVFFKKYFNELCMQSNYYVNDIHEAKDIVQEIFVKVLLKDKLDEIINFKSYFRIAVRNESLKKIKANFKKKPLDESSLNLLSSLSIEDELIIQEKYISLYKKIELLPNRCKEVFLLCVLENVKYKDASLILGVSKNTIKAQMKKAFKKLR